jgi:hypothetical protein
MKQTQELWSALVGLGVLAVASACQSILGINDATLRTDGSGGSAGNESNDDAGIGGHAGNGGSSGSGGLVNENPDGGSGGNAGVGGNASSDAGTSGFDAGADSGVDDFNACLVGTPICTADYPCQDLPAPSQDYTCRGQFADWEPLDSPSTFTDNGDATVTDLRSGLLWQQLVDADTYDWATAKTYCADLLRAGMRGWRLPTKAELESIVDFGVDTRENDPSIDATAFPGTPAAYFWSSSAYVGAAGNAWGVNFDNGVSRRLDVSSTYRVRCVHSGDPVVASAGSGGVPPGRYTFDADTVYDARTGLTWQRAVVGMGYSQTDKFCMNLPLAGGGWRLPSVSELLTLADPTRLTSAIDTTAFPNTPATLFLSASWYAAGGPWLVNFDDGQSIPGLITGQDLSTSHPIRCVRGGAG